MYSRTLTIVHQLLLKPELCLFPLRRRQEPLPLAMPCGKSGAVPSALARFAKTLRDQSHEKGRSVSGEYTDCYCYCCCYYCCYYYYYYYEAQKVGTWV